MTTTQPDPLTAFLAGVHERWDTAENAVYATLVGRAQALTSLADIPHLLAAVEAALDLAGQWRAKAFALMEQLAAEDAQGTSAALKGVGSSVHDTCAKDLREAITTALLGEDGT